MSLQIACPNPACGVALKLNDSLTNKKVRCPKCGQLFEAEAPAILRPQVENETLPLPASPDETASGNLTTTFDPRSEQSTVGRFQIRMKLGEGAFGEVFRAYDPQLDREVALKVAKPGTLTTPERIERFLREAKSAANLRHPNIVPLFDTGRDGERYFIASAFIQGRTLEAELEEGRLTQRDTARIIRKLAEALAYAHSQGIIHRDVKPANVMIDQQGEPHLMDFGLAARAESGEEKLTQEGVAMGTPAYIAPEQARGEIDKVGPASDQYSLGCTLYEMLVGHTPFSGAPAQQLFLHQTQIPKRPRSLKRDVPRDLDTVAMKCLEKEPATRFATCAELAEDLRRWQAGEPIAARPAGSIERLIKWAKRNPSLAGAVMLAVLALVVGTGVSVWQARRANQKAEEATINATEAANQTKVAKDNATEAANQTKLAIDNELEAKSQTKLAEENAGKLAVELKESRRLLDLGRLKTAQAAWDNNSVQLARDTLSEVAPENRCVAWGLLHRRFDGGLYTLHGHTGEVNCVAVSADGRRIVTGSDDNTARLWDRVTGQTLAVFKGYDAVESVAISADGRRIVTGDNRTVRIWDADTGQWIAKLIAGTGKCLAISADGRRIVTAGSPARLWDASTGNLLNEFKQASCVAISADGQRVVTGSADKTARVWDAVTGQTLVELKHTKSITSVAVSADGRRVVTGGSDEFARVWDAATGQLLMELKGHGRGHIIWSVAVSADGRRVVTGTWEIARVWDTATGERIAELKGHTTSGRGVSVRGVAISADGRQVFTASFDKTAKVWNAATEQSFIGLRGDKKATMSADGRRIVTVSGIEGENTAKVWDSASCRTIVVLKGHAGRLQSIAISADGRRVITGSEDKTARVWDADNGQTICELKGHEDRVSSVALSADGRYAFTASCDDKTVRKWDAGTGRELGELKGRIEGVQVRAVTADGQRVFTCTEHLVGVWDADTNQALASLEVGRGRLAVSADGRLLISASGGEGTAEIWDVDARKSIMELKGHTKGVYAVAMSADGRRVMTGSEDETARVWDSTTGQTLIELKGHDFELQDMAMSADGRRVLTASGGTARLWVADVEQTITKFDERRDYKFTSLAVSADGRRIVTGSNFWARVWDVGTGKSLTLLNGEADAIAISADGRRVVTSGSQDGTARVWDTATGQSLMELKGHKIRVLSVAISMDGRWVVTGSQDRTARLWDTATGQTVVEFIGHVGGVTSVAVSADGQMVVTGSYDETVRLWNAATGQTVAQLKGQTGIVRNVAVSADGQRVLTGLGDTAQLWDAATGQYLPGEPVPKTITRNDQLPDGRRIIWFDTLVMLISPPNKEELARRRFWAMPDPYWHIDQRKACENEKDLYAAALHRSFEQHARGVVAFDYNQFDKAYAHFIAAAILKPPVSKTVEILPKK